MSTIKDFENTPVGETATRDLRNWVMKADNGEQRWIIRTGLYMDNEEIERQGYTLKPPAPESAREALDLAWELAHPVREGQVIPEGTKFLRVSGDGVGEYTALFSPTKVGPLYAQVVRTLDPLPDPEPERDWLDAPAVFARHVNHAPDSRPSLWVNLGDGLWGHAETTKRAEVWDLRDVTPLYPKGQDK